jgi:hypothetical protein
MVGKHDIKLAYLLYVPHRLLVLRLPLLLRLPVLRLPVLSVLQ